MICLRMLAFFVDGTASLEDDGNEIVVGILEGRGVDQFSESEHKTRMAHLYRDETGRAGK